MLDDPLPQWDRKVMVNLARLHTTGYSAEASVLLWSIKFKLESTKPEEEGTEIGLQETAAGYEMGSNEQSSRAHQCWVD